MASFTFSTPNADRTRKSRENSQRRPSSKPAALRHQQNTSTSLSSLQVFLLRIIPRYRATYPNQLQSSPARVHTFSKTMFLEHHLLSSFSFEQPLLVSPSVHLDLHLPIQHDHEILSDIRTCIHHNPSSPLLFSPVPSCPLLSHPPNSNQSKDGKSLLKFKSRHTHETS
jgi:hypothetical protein